MTVGLAQALGALLDLQLVAWCGLPACVTADMTRILGSPAEASEGSLGAYPAHRETYPVPAAAAAGLIVYSRAHRIVAVETLEPPPIAAASPLGPPDVSRSPELSLPGYV